MEASGIQKLENNLLVTVPRDLTDDEVIRLRRDILVAVRRYDTQTVVLDFSRVDICDSFFGRFIYSTSKMVQLMGTKTIIAGLQDAVIETMVELGMVLSDIETVLDLDEALALSRSMAQEVDEEDETPSLPVTDGSGEQPHGWDSR